MQFLDEFLQDREFGLIKKFDVEMENLTSLCFLQSLKCKGLREMVLKEIDYAQIKEVKISSLDVWNKTSKPIGWKYPIKKLVLETTSFFCGMCEILEHTTDSIEMPFFLFAHLLNVNPVNVSARKIQLTEVSFLSLLLQLRNNSVYKMCPNVYVFRMTINVSIHLNPLCTTRLEIMQAVLDFTRRCFMNTQYLDIEDMGFWENQQEIRRVGCVNLKFDGLDLLSILAINSILLYVGYTPQHDYFEKAVAAGIVLEKQIDEVVSLPTDSQRCKEIFSLGSIQAMIFRGSKKIRKEMDKKTMDWLKSPKAGALNA